MPGFSNPFVEKKGLPSQKEMAAPAKERVYVEKKKPRFERALNEEDAKHVGTGLEAIYEEFETVPENDFPDMVVFMDTGARPLAAGVLPIARAVAKERGLPEPDNRFLAGTSRPPYYRNILELRETGEVGWEEEYIKERIEREKTWIAEYIEDLIGRRADLVEKPDSFFDSLNKTRVDVINGFDESILKYKEDLRTAEERVRKEVTGSIQEIVANEQALSARLKEILEQSGARRMLIIDDYLCAGLSMGQILKAFQSIDKADRPEVTFMSFFAKQYRTDESTWENEVFELDAEDQKKAWVAEGFQVLLPNQEWNTYAGFAYQYKPDTYASYAEEEDYKKADFKKGFIGVEKVSGKAISKVSPDRDVELMLQLRHEIRDISEKVLRRHQK